MRQVVRQNPGNRERERDSYIDREREERQTERPKETQGETERKLEIVRRRQKER